MSGFRPIDDPSFVGREFDLSSDDEIVAYGERGGDVPFGFHCVSQGEARRLAGYDWIVDETIRHEHAEGPDEIDDEDVSYADYDENDGFVDEFVYLCDNVEVVEVVEKLARSFRSLGTSTNYNRRMQLRQDFDQMGRLVRRYYSSAQRCHSGNDTRRRRHGDGKLLGDRNVRRELSSDDYVPEIVPTEVLFITLGPVDGVDYVESVRIK